jgi:hypothetical protein
MTDQVITQVLQTYGSLGAVLLIAGYFLRALHQQLTTLHDKRTADAQATTQKLLELVATQHQHQAMLTKAIDGNADAIAALRMVIESVAAERGFHRLPAPPAASRR